MATPVCCDTVVGGEVRRDCWQGPSDVRSLPFFLSTCASGADSTACWKSDGGLTCTPFDQLSRPDPDPGPDPDTEPMVDCYGLPKCIVAGDAQIPCEVGIPMPLSMCLQQGGHTQEDPVPGPVREQPCLQELVEYHEHWYPNTTVLFWVSYALALAFV